MREKQIEELAQVIAHSCIDLVESSCGEGECCVSCLATKLYKEGVTIQKWIPVTERLPELNDKEPDWSVTVLFRTTQGYIHSGYRNIGRPQRSFYDDDWTPPYWLDESGDLLFEEDEVTHWMPLPSTEVSE